MDDGLSSPTNRLGAGDKTLPGKEVFPAFWSIRRDWPLQVYLTNESGHHLALKMLWETLYGKMKQVTTDHCSNNQNCATKRKTKAFFFFFKSTRRVLHWPAAGMQDLHCPAAFNRFYAFSDLFPFFEVFGAVYSEMWGQPLQHPQDLNCSFHNKRDMTGSYKIKHVCILVARTNAQGRFSYANNTPGTAPDFQRNLWQNSWGHCAVDAKNKLSSLWRCCW